MNKALIGILTILIVLIATLKTSALAENISDGEQIFNIQCAGCHPNGGNIIRRGKSLQKKSFAEK